GEVGRAEGYLQAAAAGADVDAGEGHRASVDHRGEPAALAERADAADDVAGGPFGVGGRGEGEAAGAEGVDCGLDVEGAVDGDEDDRQPAGVGGDDEGLEYRARRYPERLGGHQPVGAGRRVMGV